MTDTLQHPRHPVDVYSWENDITEMKGRLYGTFHGLEISYTGDRTETDDPQVKFDHPRLAHKLFCASAYTYDNLKGLTNRRPLPPKQKQQWLDALRSGEYPQTDSYLRVLEVIEKSGQFSPPPPTQNVGFCCLGVFCEAVLHLPYVVEWSSNNSLRIAKYHVEGKDIDRREFANQSIIPEAAAPVGWEDGLQNFLASLNDNGWTFEDIATLIELAY